MIFISSKSGQKTYFESYLNIFRVDFYVSALDMRKWNSIHDLISKAETFADWINGQSTNILTGEKIALKNYRIRTHTEHNKYCIWIISMELNLVEVETGYW